MAAQSNLTHNMLLKVLLLFLSSLICDNSAEYSSSYFLCEGAYYLSVESHILDSLRVYPPSERCGMSCLAEESCQSFNVATEPDADGRFSCELLTTNSFQRKERLFPSTRFRHYSQYNPCLSKPCLNGGECEEEFDSRVAFVCHCTFGFVGQLCKRECTAPLGMESGAILGSSITARSIWGPGHEPWRGRLNNKPSLPYDAYKNTGSYSAKTNQQGEWLQIDLGQIKWVTKVATQGRPYAFSQWVTRYKISYSNDNVKWSPYMEKGTIKEFDGNVDRDTVKLNRFSDHIRARYVRILPTAWNEHISLRAELYGCRLE